MNFHFSKIHLSGKSLAALELVGIADGTTIRVRLDRDALRHAMHVDRIAPEEVGSFLSAHRSELERLIRAHLFARGIPLNRVIVLMEDELMSINPSTSLATK